ncbi:MAG: hypothetical protein WBA93_14145 [Microcoleaceae cyanobacterium]
MKTIVACRHCRYYSPEGRRGGICQKLMTPVESNWKACSLALSPFAATWENLDDLVMWNEEIDTLEIVLPIKPAINHIHKVPNKVLVGAQEQSVQSR